MVRFRQAIAAVIAVVAAIALTACSPEQFKVESAQVPQLIASTIGEPKTFNFPLSQESPNVFGFIYAGLITENGLTGAVEPALAESWQMSPDKLRITLTLRKGLKWSDGQPLTAEDVDFTYNQIYLNPKIPAPARDILRIGKAGAFPKVKALDAQRVEFTIPEPFAPFLRSTGLPILPAHSLKASVTTLGQDGQPRFLSLWGVDTDPKQIVVNGPFKIESYATGQRVVFRRNPYYWDKDAAGQPLPYLDRFVWQIVDSTDTALLQFRSGGLDVLAVSPTNFALLKQEEKMGNFTIYNGGPASGVVFVCFNLNTGRQLNGEPLVDPIKSRWFNTVAFRQAIAYGINRQALINNLYRGLGTTQNSPLSVQSPYYLPPQSGLKVYDYNLEKARQLLLGAGFKYNSKQQLLDAEDNRVRFTLLSNTGSPVVEAIGAQIKQNLDKLGIQVDFSLVGFNTLTDKLGNTLKWESYLGGFTGGVEPNDGFNMWSPDGSSHVFNQKPAPGSPQLSDRQVASWESQIGQLYIQGAQELNEEKRKAIYAETQRLTQEYLPFIYMINPLTLAAFRNSIQGAQPSGLVGGLLAPLWNLDKLKTVSD
jgi:peptide/nickel transport system substrate-binding protein